MSGQAAACRMCGAGFARYGRGAGALCKRCAAKAGREAGRALRASCKACGKGFAASTRSARYCSAECRADGARRRNREHQRKYMADPARRALAMARMRVAAAARATRERGGRPPRRQAPPRVDPNAAPSVCRLCGRGFAQYGGSNRHAYCRRCTAKADREMGRTLRASCKACGKKFSTASRAVRYCSAECRAEGLRSSRRGSDRRLKTDTKKRATAGARKGARSAARRGGAGR